MKRPLLGQKTIDKVSKKRLDGSPLNALMELDSGQVSVASSPCQKRQPNQNAH